MEVPLNSSVAMGMDVAVQEWLRTVEILFRLEIASDGWTPPSREYKILSPGREVSLAIRKAVA